jgi:CutC family
MIRPRVGDFLYSNEEMDVMLEDIEIFKGIGVAGAVFGVLDSDGTVDVPRTRMCVIGHQLGLCMLLCAMTGWWKLRFLCKVSLTRKKTDRNCTALPMTNSLFS